MGRGLSHHRRYGLKSSENRKSVRGGVRRESEQSEVGYAEHAKGWCEGQSEGDVRSERQVGVRERGVRCEERDEVMHMVGVRNTCGGMRT